MLRRHFSDTEYHEIARTLCIPAQVVCRADASAILVPVVTAGSADLPVAEEARQTLAWMGLRSKLIQDIGVAGPWRLLERLPELTQAAAIVVVAGMVGGAA